MCGIVGVFHFDRARPVDAALLLAQTDTLLHRGPNDGAVWVEGGVGLGQRRLSIIDLAGGHQPMPDLERRRVVVFNGEIYNYRELKAELESKCHRFRTDSDTETILYAHAEWGASCVEHMNGMFAFALYDRHTGELFLARDRAGKKPLYWYADADRLVFASELKAIVRDPTIPREIEPTAVADFHALSYVPAPKTIYRRISKLPAAHTLTVKPGGATQLREYWDVDMSQPERGKSIHAHARALREILTDATRLRLRSDVPLGAFLSGGIDSSATVGVMAGLLDRPVVTNSIGFSESAYDERRYAKEIAERFHTEHHEKVVSPDAIHVVHQLSWFYDEPFGDSSAVPTYYLCEMAREQVTVALSGDGGDELFAGYSRYKHGLEADRLRARIPDWAKALAREPLRLMFGVSRYDPRLRDRNALLYRAVSDFDRAFYNHLPTLPFRWKELLSRDFVEALGGYDPFVTFEPHFRRAPKDDPLSRMQYVDLKTYLCDDILVKVDRASMAHALEVRVPLLDYRVIEQAARIPAEYRLQDGVAKRVLREAISDLVPSTFFDRPKQGFGIPLFEWFRTSLRNTAAALFFGKMGGGSGLLGTLGLQRVWQEHQLGLVHHGTALWNALLFELWYQRSVERSASTVEPTPTMRSAKPAVLDVLRDPAPDEGRSPALMG